LSLSFSLLFLAKTITHAAARSLCDSWASCYIIFIVVYVNPSNSILQAEGFSTFFVTTCQPIAVETRNSAWGSAHSPQTFHQIFPQYSSLTFLQTLSVHSPQFTQIFPDILCGHFRHKFPWRDILPLVISPSGQLSWTFPCTFNSIPPEHFHLRTFPRPFP